VERVAFLDDETNQRIGCLLNPETLVMRRTAGVHPRRSATGQLTGEGLTDDPLLYTGGGRTELDLDLLFDVTLAGSSIATGDVRDLTRPLWNLAENAARPERYGQPPLVRFIWGKSWNILGVIVAVAERLEHFTSDGVPRRSWLRMRMVRANEPPPEPRSTQEPFSIEELVVEELDVPEGSVRVQALIGGTSADGEGQETPEALQAGNLIATSAADIIEEALAESGARASLNAALDTVASAAEAIFSGLASLAAKDETGAPAEEISDEEQAASTAVAAETHAIVSAIASVASAVEIEIVGAVTAATATISAAIDTIHPTLRTMTSDATASVAEKVRAAVDSMAPAVAAMRRTAAAVARAVKAKSALVIATAVDGLSSAVDAIGVGLNSVATAASAVGRETVPSRLGQALLGSAADRVDGVLETIRTTGETAAREALPAVLETLAEGVECLWAAGAIVAVRTVESAAKLLAIGLRNVTAAAEAIAAVLITPTADLVASSAESIRTTLAAIDTGAAAGAVAGAAGDEAVSDALGVISQSLQRIESLLPIVASQGDAGTRRRQSEVLRTLRDVTASPEALVSSEALSQIGQGLDEIIESIEQVQTQEKAATAEMVRTAVDAVGQRPEERALARVAASFSLGIGQRLDQLAYHHYGDPALWRVLAAFNHVAHPLRLPAGQLLRVPPLSALTGRPPVLTGRLPVLTSRLPVLTGRLPVLTGRR
jgi:hypothetical protein